MNESEKERLIKKDIESIENRVRHAFNQGYEMGLKESSSEIPTSCGDAIIWECSECNETQKRRTKHCPNCGCKLI